MSAEVISLNIKEVVKKCAHCDEPIALSYFSKLSKEKEFCCLGCVTVYEIINEKGLQEYYDIKQDSAILKRRAPAEINTNKYLYLDDSQFLKDYSSEEHGIKTLEFYLEGIHCLACLWIIEKLPQIIKGVEFSRLDIGKSTAKIGINSNGKFSEVARELHNLGYKPHPIKKNTEQTILQRQEERTFLKRMGIAAAGSMNIMLYAVSIYAGASDIYAEIFGILTVVLAIPVMTYSAYPFYLSAYSAIKNKRLNLDVPIAMALLLGFIYGLFNISRLNHENYLDSLTALVFLLLITRYFLMKIQQWGLTANDLNYFYASNSVLVKDSENHFREIHPSKISVGDILKIRPSEIIPVDGFIKSGESFLNVSLINGESKPLKVRLGDHVFSGTENLNNEIEIEASKTLKDSRIGKLLKSVENGWSNRARIVQFTDKVSGYFISAVFFFSILAFLFFYNKGNLNQAFNYAITLLIVTCPCALALATPMTLTNSMSKASKKGIIIKNDEVIQKLSEVKNIILDKTGTITFGKFKVLDFIFYKYDEDFIFSLIQALEMNSKHPIAQSLLEFTFRHHLKKLNLAATVLHGKGVETQYNGFQYFIGAIKSKDTKIEQFEEIFNEVGLYENNELIAKFRLADTLRPDSKEVIKKLKKLGFNIFLLTGDKKEIALKISNEVGIESKNVFYEVTPEKKASVILKLDKPVMIGDGANDAIAQSNAYVGIAVSGAMDISLRASDVYLTNPGLTPILDLFTISKETMFVIYRNLFISLTYNLASVCFVFLGLINPMIAAIVMPTSSLTVLFSTLFGTQKLRKLFKEKC